jgi:hydrogenase expression/formation protein HypC
MCLGVPGQILEPLGAGLARADVGGVRREISTALLDGEAAPGDWVLIHVGFALNRIDEEQARATLDLLEGLEE